MSNSVNSAKGQGQGEITAGERSNPANPRSKKLSAISKGGSSLLGGGISSGGALGVGQSKQETESFAATVD